MRPPPRPSLCSPSPARCPPPSCRPAPGWLPPAALYLSWQLQRPLLRPPRYPRQQRRRLRRQLPPCRRPPSQATRPEHVTLQAGMRAPPGARANRGCLLAFFPRHVFCCNRTPTFVQPPPPVGSNRDTALTLRNSFPRFVTAFVPLLSCSRLACSHRRQARRVRSALLGSWHSTAQRANHDAPRRRLSTSTYQACLLPPALLPPPQVPYNHLAPSAVPPHAIPSHPRTRPPSLSHPLCPRSPLLSFFAQQFCPPAFAPLIVPPSSGPLGLWPLPAPPPLNPPTRTPHPRMPQPVLLTPLPFS